MKTEQQIRDKITELEQQLALEGNAGYGSRQKRRKPNFIREKITMLQWVLSDKAKA